MAWFVSFSVNLLTHRNNGFLGEFGRVWICIVDGRGTGKCARDACEILMITDTKREETKNDAENATISNHESKSI
jgi:hypothetical protein